MIVVDASALLEVLLRTPAAPPIEWRLLTAGQALAAPHLLDVEIAQVLRRYVASGQITAVRGRQALEDLRGFALTRYPHDILLDRVWALRDNVSAYDAVYVALAEGLGVPLVTRDHRLAAAAGHRANIELV